MEIFIVLFRINDSLQAIERTAGSCEGCPHRCPRLVHNGGYLVDSESKWWANFVDKAVVHTSESPVP